VPKGLAYVEGDSTIIESPSVKAASSSIAAASSRWSLGNAMRSTLESERWRHISTAMAADKATTQVHDKPGMPAVRVWRVGTHLRELTTSRSLGSRRDVVDK